MSFTGNGITSCYPDEVENFISITVLSVAIWGCSTRQIGPTSQLSQETRETIAECTGGISEQAQQELAAVVGRLNGQLIAESNYEIEPGSIFALGEVTGETAVQMYNAYVECLNRSQSSYMETVGEPVPRWRHHNVGELPGGEIVVQVPLPSETRYGNEIQLQIVKEAEHWVSQGRPYWTSICSDFWADVKPIGNRNSYTYRFQITLANQYYRDRQADCHVTLYAQAPESGPNGTTPEGRIRYYWQRTFRIQVTPNDN